MHNMAAPFPDSEDDEVGGPFDILGEGAANLHVGKVHVEDVDLGASAKKTAGVSGVRHTMRRFLGAPKSEETKRIEAQMKKEQATLKKAKEVDLQKARVRELEEKERKYQKKLEEKRRKLQVERNKLQNLQR